MEVTSYLTDYAKVTLSQGIARTICLKSFVGPERFRQQHFQI
jgi:hypothetical protein